MKLVRDNENAIWVAESTFAEKDIPKAAKFRWNPDRKCWWTDDPTKAARLAEFADGAVRAELDQVADDRQAALAASTATDADICIPAPAGMQYMPFQKAGIAFCASRPNALIADEMGLGKTIQAIGLINMTQAKRILIICPASLRLNWRNELQAWLTDDLTIGIAQGKSFPADTDIVIINYDIVHTHAAALREAEWDLLIADEIHYCKNEKARRTKYTLGYVKSERQDGKWREVVKVAPIPAKRRIFLTGTPIMNRPVELWPIVKALGIFANFFRFARRYSAAHRGRFGWDFTGASNLPELQERLRTDVMVRRLKKDVLADLPAKVRQVIEVPANGASEAVNDEQDAWAEWEDQIVELRAAVELAKASDDPAIYADAVTALQDGSSVAFSEISKMRQETAVAKIPIVVSHLAEVLEGTDKVVVMAHHHAVIDGLSAALTEADIQHVTLTGRDSMDARQAAVESFQTDPGVRIFIGSIQAAGVGITLTAAAHVLFAELDWVPANLSQAEDRCHRIGQTDSVLVQHLVLEGSLDSVMAKNIVSKQRVIDSALDDDIPEFEMPTIPLPEAQTTTVKAIEAAAALITPEHRAAVHNALLMLSGMCDGAVADDGQGFSKIDTLIGHSLAKCIVLTPKQAALGQRLVTRYQRQLPSDLILAAGITPKGNK